MRLIHKPNGLDLTKAEDAEWLLERVTAHQPDVLFIGPFYRLHNTNMNDELRRPPSRNRARPGPQLKVDCALVIEAHAGHGNAIHERDISPPARACCCAGPSSATASPRWTRPTSGSSGSGPGVDPVTSANGPSS
jgi:hypothetical protein